MPETQGDSNARPLAGILQRIVRTKRRELERLSDAGALREAAEAAPPARDFAGALRRQEEVALIAEVKRRSPGAGTILPGLEPAEVAGAYRSAGAAAVSVLTDREYFGGGLDDLRAVREATDLPVLRKDFTIDPRQILEARAAGADAVLLIARILDDAALVGLAREAERLGMAALVEVHDARELERALRAGATLVGINNRDLDTFRTRLDVTLNLLGSVPASILLVSESGIRSGEDVRRLGHAGVDAVLVGEALLRGGAPGEAAAALVGQRRRPRGEPAGA